MIAAAEPSDTPEQSKMPSAPATWGEQAMTSLATSLRNCARAVLGGADGRQAGDARVLQLLHPDGHRHVVGAGSDRVARVAKGLGAGGAVVLEPAHRLVVELERAR